MRAPSHHKPKPPAAQISSHTSSNLKYLVSGMEFVGVVGLMRCALQSRWWKRALVWVDGVLSSDLCEVKWSDGGGGGKKGRKALQGPLPQHDRCPPGTIDGPRHHKRTCQLSIWTWLPGQHRRFLSYSILCSQVILIRMSFHVGPSPTRF